MNRSYLNRQFRDLTICSLLIFIALLIYSLNSAAQNNVPGKIHFGLIYPLSTNGTHAPLDTNHLSIHLLAGVSSSEQGLSLAGFANVIRNNSSGPQFAGFANISGGDVKGAQFAGFINMGKEIKGAQFAGFINTASSVKGSQFAGFINYAAKDVSASQFAGFINKAQDVNGIQVAGFINVAKKVKGAQIAGFINVADSSDFPIGFINIIKNGEKSLGISIDENLTTMLSFKSGGKVLYGILGIGYNFRNKDELYAYEAGLGAHFFSQGVFRINTELISSVLEDFKAKTDYFKASLNVMPAIKIGNSIEIFGGPSLNFINTNSSEGKTLYTKFIKSWNANGPKDFKALYLGYSGGINFLF